MKQKLFFVSVLLIVFGKQLSKAQTSSTKQLVRATTGTSGSSENVSTNNHTYLIQQSIGQASVIGTLYDSKYIVRQGFIQPSVLAKILDVNIPLSLEAVAYPNPFIESITLSFSEQITNNVHVSVYDLFGRVLFSKDYKANQKINVQFNNLSVADYILKVTANNKQFIKKILKR
ncbi:T9SS type A sorting domain-containing protein [Gillisia marina]|uniref:T9SS type A sorting domain-containing protein n=1 Tax=Gillisia marina TaxID=1167637 RepID=UPI00029AB076|nr:T9SS type A sorting domain-containing protein [Gillisia marina]